MAPLSYSGFMLACSARLRSLVLVGSLDSWLRSGLSLLDSSLAPCLPGALAGRAITRGERSRERNSDVRSALRLAPESRVETEQDFNGPLVHLSFVPILALGVLSLLGHGSSRLTESAFGTEQVWAAGTPSWKPISQPISQ